MSTISEKLALLARTKAAIKAAIEAKGQSVGEIPFSQYPARIEALEAPQQTGYSLTVNGSAGALDLGTLKNAALAISLEAASNGEPVVVAKSPEAVAAQVVVAGADAFRIELSIPRNAGAESVAGYVDIAPAQAEDAAMRVQWVQAAPAEEYFIMEGAYASDNPSIEKTADSGEQVLKLAFTTNEPVEDLDASVAMGDSFLSCAIVSESPSYAAEIRGTLEITVAENTSGNTRYGTVMLTCSSGTVYIEITQSGGV